MPFWTQGSGLILGDGGLLLCDECPCLPGSTEIVCNTGATSIYPPGTDGYWSVVLSGFTGCTQFNGTFVFPTTVDSVDWGAGSQVGILSGRSYTLAVSGFLGAGPGIEFCYYLIELVIGNSFETPRATYQWRLDMAPTDVLDFRSPITIPFWPTGSFYTPTGFMVCGQGAAPNDATLQALPL